MIEWKSKYAYMWKKTENLIFINVMHKIKYLLGNSKCQIECNKNGNWDNGRVQISKLRPWMKCLMFKLRHWLYEVLEVNVKIISKVYLCIICEFIFMYKHICMKVYSMDINVLPN